ncbi:MAG: hypothetical protein JST53_14730 [Actinobacteria bacterium]|nr:hypothetical protein [Actinomycetota bacterium]
MSLPTLGSILLVLILAWTLGGALLRLGGLILILVGALCLALGGGPVGLLLIGLGAVLWALGQAHHALRHGTYRGPLARLAFEGRDRREPAVPQETGLTVDAAERASGPGRRARAPRPRRCG